MKKVKNIKVGDVVEFPYYQFAPYRRGWNGWLFKVAIVKKLYTSTKGYHCAELVYQTDAREYTEATHKIRTDFLFEFDLDFLKRIYAEKGIESKGFDLCKANGLI